VRYGVPALRALLRSPLAGPLDAAIGRLPEGPSEAARAKVRWTVAAVAYGEDGSTGSALVEGRDVYGLTALLLVRGAEALRAGEARATGALAPAEAFDPRALVERLAPLIRIDSEEDL
jgi:short subunit dehydrogenase-like uncharacterized protein